MANKRKTVAAETTNPTVKAEAPRTTLDFLPDADELARYEKVVPGGAERILELAEKKAQHQHELEERGLAAEIRAARIKQALTFVLALATGALGGALLLMGSELAGLIVILVDAAAIAGIAIYGKTEQ